MSAYSELIKNFEKIREIMREFYVYGFKSREEYDKKSARSYDDDRRRLESWLGDYMSFIRTPEGKNIFISIDSRVSNHNPFYKAWKSKSFTDGDITLHFIIFDILSSEETILSLPEIMGAIDNYLSDFDTPMEFDESTVRKKLKEYINTGIIEALKDGKKMLYKRAEDITYSDITDILNFYSEVAPCGVIGSFLLDKYPETENTFGFKHHYITSAMDSDVLSDLFYAMRKKCAVTVTNVSKRKGLPTENKIIPLRIFISVQNGRQHLLAYQPALHAVKSFRIDYLSDVKIEEVVPDFDVLRSKLDEMQENMWGVTAPKSNHGTKELEHIDFTVKISDKEEHIIRRLNREKRVGSVEKIDDNTYKFSADVADVNEMIPWLRTFICRITELNISDEGLKKQFMDDIEKMYIMYGIGEVEG